jgi:hypothetical protein
MTNNAATETAVPIYSALQFDPGAFVQFVDDESLSEEEARALLEEIWKIVVAFVDLGFPVGRPLDKSSGPSEIWAQVAFETLDSRPTTFRQEDENAAGRHDQDAK